MPLGFITVLIAWSKIRWSAIQVKYPKCAILSVQTQACYRLTWGKMRNLKLLKSFRSSELLGPGSPQCLALRADTGSLLVASQHSILEYNPRAGQVICWWRSAEDRVIPQVQKRTFLISLYWFLCYRWSTRPRWQPRASSLGMAAVWWSDWRTWLNWSQLVWPQLVVMLFCSTSSPAR